MTNEKNAKLEHPISEMHKQITSILEQIDKLNMSVGTLSNEVNLMKFTQETLLRNSPNSYPFNHNMDIAPYRATNHIKFYGVSMSAVSTLLHIYKILGRELPVAVPNTMDNCTDIVLDVDKLGKSIIGDVLNKFCDIATTEFDLMYRAPGLSDPQTLIITIVGKDIRKRDLQFFDADTIFGNKGFGSNCLVSSEVPGIIELLFSFVTKEINFYRY